MFNPTSDATPNFLSSYKYMRIAGTSLVLIAIKINIQYLWKHITGMSFGDDSRKLLEDETAIGSDWDKWETVSQWTH